MNFIEVVCIDNSNEADLELGKHYIVLGRNTSKNTIRTYIYKYNKGIPEYYKDFNSDRFISIREYREKYLKDLLDEDE